jgi:hypothetical protein
MHKVYVILNIKRVDSILCLASPAFRPLKCQWGNIASRTSGGMRQTPPPMRCLLGLPRSRKGRTCYAFQQTADHKAGASKSRIVNNPYPLYLLALVASPSARSSIKCRFNYLRIGTCSLGISSNLLGIIGAFGLSFGQRIAFNFVLEVDSRESEQDNEGKHVTCLHACSRGG